ncbi:hypothetical protein lpa_01392 [Legionella pneumophila 2300/99 Alcoy]|nr:hypothetical protein lpa_01392 [Legionella pneumophila 2300/99 Alcoy]
MVSMSEAIANLDRQFAIKTASLPMREWQNLTIVCTVNCA